MLIGALYFSADVALPEVPVPCSLVACFSAWPSCDALTFDAPVDLSVWPLCDALTWTLPLVLISFISIGVAGSSMLLQLLERPAKAVSVHDTTVSFSTHCLLGAELAAAAGIQMLKARARDASPRLLCRRITLPHRLMVAIAPKLARVSHLVQSQCPLSTQS